MLNRRAFLGSLAACAVAPFVPTPAAVTPSALAFHPDAFALAMAPLNQITRFDVLSGWGVSRPDFACRVEAAEPYRASENYRAYLEHDAAIQAAVV